MNRKRQSTNFEDRIGRELADDIRRFTSEKRALWQMCGAEDPIEWALALAWVQEQSALVTERLDAATGPFADSGPDSPDNYHWIALARRYAEMALGILRGDSHAYARAEEERKEVAPRTL